MLLTLPEEVRQLLRLVQHHLFMIYRIDDEFYFSFSEGMIAEKFNIHTRYVKNRTLHSIFKQKTYDVFINNIIMAFSGKSVQFEAQYDQSTMLISLEPIKRGSSIAEIMGSAFDVTMQKKAEEELRLALEQERQLNALKSGFIQTVSHEFRTPLAGISIASELLEHYMDKMDTSVRLRTLQSIRFRTEELTTFMDDLLTQSAAGSLSSLYQPTLVDPKTVSEELVQEYIGQMRTPTHTIEIVVDSNLPRVAWDKRLVKHIFRNLLSNCIKYSPNGTLISIELRSNDTHLLLTITDRGIGIPEEDLPHVVTAFYRSQQTGVIKGTGLGLTIVKEFVEMHNGYLVIHSEIGVGTAVTVHFPIVEAHSSTILTNNKSGISSSTLS